ncbi:MAG: SDR family oxidoreductase [Bacteroidales bacterium]|nr:SDR family oxidoreductase [Bacteroidales bacterium]
MFNPFSIEGKTILVTGAASGMGKATAIACTKMGAKIVAVDFNAEGLSRTMSELEGEGHQSFVLNLAEESTWADLLENAPIIDGMANCAGIANMNPFMFVNRDEFNRVFNINFFGPVLLTKGLIKAKKLNKGGSVVFVASMDGPLIVHAGNSVYSASKSALVGISRNMAIDLAPKKIRVNCLLPGTTDTPLIRTDNVTEESLAEVAKTFPLKRFGTVEDMAYGIIYLLSDASSFVTGTELVIDGGYTKL